MNFVNIIGLVAAALAVVANSWFWIDRFLDKRKEILESKYAFTALQRDEMTEAVFLLILGLTMLNAVAFMLGMILWIVFLPISVLMLLIAGFLALSTAVGKRIVDKHLAKERNR